MTTATFSIAKGTEAHTCSVQLSIYLATRAKIEVAVIG